MKTDWEKELGEGTGNTSLHVRVHVHVCGTCNLGVCMIYNENTQILQNIVMISLFYFL